MMNKPILTWRGHKRIIKSTPLILLKYIVLLILDMSLYGTYSKIKLKFIEYICNI